jgi:hypothetical protein
LGTLVRDLMTARRLRACVAAALVALVLAGCGQSAAQRTPDLGRLPLVKGAQISLEVKRCDKGANAFCAWELVVIAPRYRSADRLLKDEHHLLNHSGWTNGNADTGQQQAADSPGHKLRVTFATAAGDLQGIDLGWIKRSRKITLALSHAMFEHAAAMSMLLEIGAS